MAIVAHLVERTLSAGDNDVRDGIAAVIVAINDAVDTTGALIQARAVTVLNAQGKDLPVGYFDVNRSIVATFDAADDMFLVSGAKDTEVVA
jgi:hypothetical protein